MAARSASRPATMGRKRDGVGGVRSSWQGQGVGLLQALDLTASCWAQHNVDYLYNFCDTFCLRADYLVYGCTFPALLIGWGVPFLWPYSLYGWIYLRYIVGWINLQAKRKLNCVLLLSSGITSAFYGRYHCSCSHSRSAWTALGQPKTRPVHNFEL